MIKRTFEYGLWSSDQKQQKSTKYEFRSQTFQTPQLSQHGQSSLKTADAVFRAYYDQTKVGIVGFGGTVSKKLTYEMKTDERHGIGSCEPELYKT